jgi:hypothetical protein
MTAWRWALLSLVAAGGIALRVHDVSRIFLWSDENWAFNERVYGNPPLPVFDFAFWVQRESGNFKWGWPAVIWETCRIFGGTIGIARAPSVMAGGAAVLLIFFLVYRLLADWQLADRFAGERFYPAIFAAILAATAINPLELSQRTYSYGAVPALTAALLLAHFSVRRAIAEANTGNGSLLRAIGFYAVAASVGVTIHASLVVLVGISGVFLAADLVLTWSLRTRGQNLKIVGFAAAAAPLFLLALYLTHADPHSGYRYYLHQYYHPTSHRAIVPLIKHAYDLCVYQVNLFYNTSLYWPERLNPVLLPLVLVCLLGWRLAAMGRFGPAVRQLAWMGITLVALLAVLSMSIFRYFPFGGLRQTIFLSPLFLSFTALGFWSLRATPIAKAVGVLVAVFYLAMWGINLPRFYRERVSTYTTADIVETWKANGKLPLYCWTCYDEIRYAVKDYPDIHVTPIENGRLPQAPYFLVLTLGPLEPRYSYFQYFGMVPPLLEKAGEMAVNVVERPAAHQDGWECRCLYFPPDGLWMYKVEAK